MSTEQRAESKEQRPWSIQHGAKGCFETCALEASNFGGPEAEIMNHAHMRCTLSGGKIQTFSSGTPIPDAVVNI